MFDIGLGEIMVTAVVALVVLGPERLPKVARFAGLCVRRARVQWHSVKAELESELDDGELRRHVHRAHSEIREAADSARELVDPVLFEPTSIESSARLVSPAEEN